LKIGLFGGSFDPVHNGHLIVAERVREDFALDLVLFLPAAQNPLKKKQTDAGDEDRVKMIQLAIESNPFFKMCDLDLKRGGRSYAVETISLLKNTEYASDDFYWIAGADILPELHLWKDYKILLQEVQMIILSRDNVLDSKEFQKTYSNLIFYAHQFTSLSSTLVRKLAREGKSLRYLVPEPVRLWIEEKKLYKK